MPIHLVGVLLPTIPGSELSRVRTELKGRRVLAAIPPPPVQASPHPSSHRYLGNVPLPACPVAFNRNHGIAPASGASSLVSFLPFTSPDCSDECREWHHCGLSLARSSNRCITGTSLLTWRHNHSTLPRQYTELDRCFMCRRCGAVLTQPTARCAPWQ